MPAYSGSEGHSDPDPEGPGLDLAEEGQADNEFYNFLHVPRTASPEEVTAAYKRLTRLYHPDKHMDETKKKNAELMFNKLKQAYGVLIDPKKRAIYDCLGKSGLQEHGWELVQRTKTPGEIREEYERLAKERAERRLQQRTNPTSSFQMTIDARDLFERYLYDEEFDDVIESSLPSLEISEISFGQTIDCPITNADNVVLSGNVATSNGTGHGGVGCSWKRVVSEKTSYETSIQLGNASNLGTKLFRRLTPRTFVNMSGTLQFTSRGIRPDFSVSFGHQLSKKAVGYLSYTSSWQLHETDEAFLLQQEQHGMSTMLVHNGESYRFMGSIHLGIPNTFMMLAISRKLEGEDQCRVRGNIKFGTFGGILEYGVEKKVTSHSTLGATMVIGIPVGITLRIKLTRAQQTYLFPIQLSDEILMQPLFYGTITPLIAWFTFKKLVLDPFEARKKRKEREDQARANRLRVAESRREAEVSVDLMRERFNRIRAEEESKNGLVILLALYGKISVIDVTVPVQCLVEEHSRLALYEGNKYDLGGFYDPCPLEEDKSLLVRYLYQGQVHQVVICDQDPVRLPKNAHRLSKMDLDLSQSSSSQ
eukprot:maker-scaffold224_size251237-snap-gene-0.18 protein:Tk05439 transcript:maker-scaffold224_size251237-snap-gene-0.18-mRNA-1 annotation:"-like protein subfamily c member 11"